MRKVCISQPMLFPWVGLLEQVRLCDAYVHYDDVQFSKGSFTNRVQVKTHGGTTWMTVPLKNTHLGQHINAVEINESIPWRAKHLALLEQSYARAPYLGQMMDLVRGVYGAHQGNLCELVSASLLSVANYYGLLEGKFVTASSRMGIGGKGSVRVLEIVQRLEGGFYITGHGAANYLEHERFEEQGIQVGYMEYQKKPYPQLHGPFTPFVSSLDLVANCGKDGRDVICSGTVDWKEFCK